MKIREVIDRITAYHPPLDDPKTTDVVKYGDPERECTGIVTCCFPSAEVIRRAAELGANLIVAHEPLFWTNEDETDWLEDSRAFAAKRALLDDAGIVVWRDHDHIHGGKPRKDLPHRDMIFCGIMQELGWEEYLVESPNKPLVFELPEIDAEELGRELIEKLGLRGLRIAGDRHARVSRVFLCEHLRDHDWKEKEKIERTEKEGFDAVIPLELIDWSLCSFIRDCSELGMPKVLYNVGHFNLEELGMKYMARWLPELVEGTPVWYVPSGDAYDFIL